jgi:hypothetical protein
MIEFTSANLQLEGGRFDITEHLPSDYVKLVDSDALRFGIVETVRHGALFGSSANLSVDDTTLTRLHLFGPGGDFTLRRDANQYYWRYIGYNTISFPTSGRDFWEASASNSKLRVDDGAPIFSMLWGKHTDADQWYEDRVGRARLTYPVGGQPSRVLLCSYRLETADDHLASHLVAYWSTAIISANEKTGVPPCPIS